MNIVDSLGDVTGQFYRCSVCEGDCGPGRPRSYCVLCELNLLSTSAEGYGIEPWIAEVLAHARAELITARKSLKEGAEVSSPATPQLEELVKQWRSSADWMMGSTKPDEWQRGGSGYLRACANELEAVLHGAASAAPPAGEEKQCLK